MKLSDLLRKLGGSGDNVQFEDVLMIKLRKDGKTVKEWSVKGNTWTTTGREKIRDALCDGGFTKISYMVANGTGGTEQPTTNSKPASNEARFVATWPASGAITNITSFSLRQTSGGPVLATVSVDTFSKPDGIELQVTWTTTIS